MTRHFCDRCQEQILDGKYQSGDNVTITDCLNKKQSWSIEIRIRPLMLSGEPGPHGWMLCKLCANEIMEQANEERNRKLAEPKKKSTP